MSFSMPRPPGPRQGYQTQPRAILQSQRSPAGHPTNRGEEFDGYSCIFCTAPCPRTKCSRFYFNKDIVEKAFRSLKGITQLRPVRHWLAERVHAHVFLCYLAYLLLSLLQYRLRDRLHGRKCLARAGDHAQGLPPRRQKTIPFVSCRQPDQEAGTHPQNDR